MKFFKNKKKINYLDKFVSDIEKLGFVLYENKLEKSFYKHNVYDQHYIIISVKNVTRLIYIMYWSKLNNIHNISVSKKNT